MIGPDSVVSEVQLLESPCRRSVLVTQPHTDAPDFLTFFLETQGDEHWLLVHDLNIWTKLTHEVQILFCVN